MGLNYYASSPVVVLPPQQPNNYFGGAHNLNASPHMSPMLSDTPMTNGRTARSKFPPRPPSLNYLATSPKGLAGRKRSRDDVVESHDEELDDGSYAVRAPPKPRGEPVYGPGMTLIYPDDPGFHIAVGSQTGTWAEEKEAELEKTSRPIAISRKSQRLVGDVKLRNPFGEPTPTSSSPVGDDVQTVDRLNLALGIGWKRIPQELAPAAAGWERFISNHFKLESPSILLQHEGLKVFLVHASRFGQERFWVFQDDLKLCQCVGATQDVAIAALTHMEPDSEGIMRNRILTEGEPMQAESRPVMPSAHASMGELDNLSPTQMVDGDIDMEL